MALVEWTQSYSVNVKEFDGHHQHLFDLLNTLHESMREGKGREVICEVVGALEDYAKRHFSAEEDVMRRTNYAGMAAHVSEHRKFVAQISRIQRDLAANKGSATHEVVTILQDWLKHHIAKSDRAYVPHMAANRVQ